MKQTKIKSIVNMRQIATRGTIKMRRTTKTRIFIQTSLARARQEVTKR